MAQQLRVDAKKIIKDLAPEINFKGGDTCETGKPYDHLKLFRLLMTGETRIQPNPKHLKFVANQLRLTGAKTRPTPGVLSHRATMVATPLLTAFSVASSAACLSSSPPAPRQSVQGISSCVFVEDSILVSDPGSSQLIHRRLRHDALSSPVFLRRLIVVVFRRFHQRSLPCFLVCQLHLGAVTCVRSWCCASQPLRFLDECRILGFASEASPPRHRRPLCLSVNLHVCRSRSNRRRTVFHSKMIRPFEVFLQSLP